MELEKKTLSPRKMSALNYYYKNREKILLRFDTDDYRTKARTRYTDNPPPTIQCDRCQKTVAVKRLPGHQLTNLCKNRAAYLEAGVKLEGTKVPLEPQ